MHPEILCRFVFSLLAASAFGLSAQAPLRLASDPWPPFTGRADQPRVVIDLVEAALRRAEIPAVVEMVPPGMLTEKLRDGSVQGSPALWKTAERKKFLLFSDPILENRLLLVGRKDRDVSAASFRELAGKKVGIVEGYGYGPEVTESEMILVPGRSPQENLTRLLAGEVDYILVNELLIQYAVQHQKSDLDKYIRYGKTPLLRRSLHFALRRDLPGAAGMVSAFNRELNVMIRNGQYQELLRLPWLEMDVDGDGKNELVYHGTRAGSEQPLRRYQPFITDPADQEADRRYRIGGKLYSSWEEVPGSLKSTENSEARGVLFEFTF